MSTVSGREAIGFQVALPEEVHLVNWPLRDDAVRAWLGLGAAVIVAVMAAVLAESRAMGLLSFSVLAAALWRLWLPVTFQVGQKGIVHKALGRRRRIPWSRIARYEIRRDGVLLLPVEDTSPLAVMRGLYIRWGPQRDQLLAWVRHYVVPQPHVPDSSVTQLPGQPDED